MGASPHARHMGADGVSEAATTGGASPDRAGGEQRLPLLSAVPAFPRCWADLSDSDSGEDAASQQEPTATQPGAATVAGTACEDDSAPAAGDSLVVRVGVAVEGKRSSAATQCSRSCRRDMSVLGIFGEGFIVITEAGAAAKPANSKSQG